VHTDERQYSLSALAVRLHSRDSRRSVGAEPLAGRLGMARVHASSPVSQLGAGLSIAEKQLQRSDRCRQIFSYDANTLRSWHINFSSRSGRLVFGRYSCRGPAEEPARREHLFAERNLRIRLCRLAVFQANSRR